MEHESYVLLCSKITSFPPSEQNHLWLHLFQISMTELSTVCSKINGINFHGLETDKSNSVRLCSYCWAYNIFHLGMAAIRNFCAGLIALVARLYKVETSEITPSPHITRFPLMRISTYADFSLCTRQWGNSSLVETLVQSH